MNKFSTAPFPYFGGKRTVVSDVWARLGRPRQYIEPFCGSAAMLLGNRHPASLEVIGDVNFYIANFWRAVKYQPQACAEQADYPVSHIDLAARHAWLTQPARTAALMESLLDPEWPGDARIAGWWAWGHTASVKNSYCLKSGVTTMAVPQIGQAGVGFLTARTDIHKWFGALGVRLSRVRILHGQWAQTLNLNHGRERDDTAIFFDPPYKSFESLYCAEGQAPVADAVAAWCGEHPHLRIALCGHRGDYDLPGWEVWNWVRSHPAAPNSTKPRAVEAIWFSPACAKVARQELLL